MYLTIGSITIEVSGITVNDHKLKIENYSFSKIEIINFMINDYYNQINFLSGFQ